MTTPTFGFSPLYLAQPHIPGAPASGTQQADAPASTGAPGTAPGIPRPQSQSPFGGTFILPLIAVMVVMLLLTTMSGRKEKKRRAELLSGVAKNDRVQTVGGVIGTVVELSEAEMVLRVDEASNTRVRFARSALQQILKSSRDRGNGSDVEVKPAVPARV